MRGWLLGKNIKINVEKNMKKRESRIFASFCGINSKLWHHALSPPALWLLEETVIIPQSLQVINLQAGVHDVVYAGAGAEPCAGHHILPAGPPRPLLQVLTQQFPSYTGR